MSSGTLEHPVLASKKIPVTADKALFTYYDIETLGNVFTLCTYNDRTKRSEVFYLVDPDMGVLDQGINGGGFDPKRAWEAIVEANPAYGELRNNPSLVTFHDLSQWEGNLRLAQIFGLSDADSVNDPQAHSTYTEHLRPVCDTDPDYDPFNTHAYLAGYNSFNYDSVMLALYLMTAFSHLGNAVAQGLHPSTGFTPARTRDLRGYNDDLFTEEFRSYMPRYLTHGPVSGGQGWASIPHKIRQAMMDTGRHIDIAKFNESQQRVALKRLLGGEGRQILESDKLGVHNNYVETVEDFYALLAYNISDCVGLHHLAQHPTYASGFDLKKGLLDEYPETIYAENKWGSYKVGIRPDNVRRSRLTPDSTSAKFVGIILSPYGNLKDIETVSFMYPSEKVAKEQGIEQVNVLEECRTFFYESISDPDARAQFDLVYGYYKSIEGRNFNDSPEYAEAFPSITAEERARREVFYLKSLPKVPNNLPYFKADGTPSSCFATFSTGGIHGAEADIVEYEEDVRKWQEEEDLIQQVKAIYPEALDVRNAKEVEIPFYDRMTGQTTQRTVHYTEVIASKTTIKALKERAARIQEIVDAQNGHPATTEQIAMVDADYVGIGYKLTKPKPVLFEVKKTDGSNKLKPKYAFTSADPVTHEDFTSYYPNLLRNMSAFYNPQLGEDRYAKIFFDKERYGAEMKQPGLDPVEQNRLKVLREGTKLILNTASGAGDTTHKTPIRMNNMIISMRIIGQLFSWRIGQAQTHAGARIISTNTDGLYSVLDEEINNRVLAEQAASIGVDIEPEPLIIVSKDSNNRLELIPPEKDEQGNYATPVWEAKIASASGASLSCHKGPQPTKSLAHPAVLDYALARYLRYIVGGFIPKWRDTPITLDEPLDRRMAKQIMLEAIHTNTPVMAARLFQNMIAASSGKITFPFVADPVDPLNPEDTTINNPRALQHYNRIFVVHQGKPGAVSLRAAGAWMVNAPSKLRRKRDGLSPVDRSDRVAMGILRHNGFAENQYDATTNNLALLPADQDVAVRKVPGIDASWSILVENRDLWCLGDEKLRDLLGCLDLDIYVDMLEVSYGKTWKNHADPTEAESDSADDE